MAPRGCQGLLSGALVLACALAFAVPARADFATVTKTFPGGTVSTALLAGNPVVYEIKVVTGTASTNVVVEDRLPTDGFGNQQVAFISSDCDSSDPLAPVPPCLGGHATQTAPGVLRWVFPGTTGPGETLTMHLNVRLNDNLDDGTLVRNAVTATDSTGASITSGFATVTVRAAKLTVTKTAATAAGPLADGAPLLAGDLITYTLAVTNTGVSDANGVVIHDLLPADETFVTGSATPAGFPDLCVVCGLFSDGIVEWQYEVLQPGQTVTLTFDAQVDATAAQGTLLLNVATALDTVGHVGMDTHTSVVSFPCLGVTKTLTCTPADSLCGGMPNTCVANDQPAPEDRVTITITVSNGAQTGCAMANEVQLVDSLPVGANFANCTDDCVFNGTDVLWNLGGIGPGDSRAVAVTLRIEPNVGDGTVLKDVATATARDGAKAASTATITVRPPILMLTAVGSPSPVEPGGTLTYAFNLTNAGISCSAGVSLVDTLPSNAPFVLGSLDTNGCGVPAVSFSADEPKFSITNFDLKAGERCTGSFRLFIPEDTALGQTLVNRISAIDSHLNAAPAAQVSTSVQTRLIGLSKIVSGCTSPSDGLACPDFSDVLTGSELSYSLTASTGPFTSTGVRVTDTLPDPAVATFVATDCPSMTLDGTVLVCSLGTIAANSSKTFRVIVKTNDTNTPGTVITNMAMATNDAMDALGVSNSVTDAVDVVVVAPPTPTPTPTPVPTPGPELQIRVTAPQAVRRGGRIRFEVEVRNVGDATAHSVVLTDTLPARLRLGRVPRVRGMRAACSGNKKTGTFTCNLGDLAPAQGRSLMVSTSVRRRGRQRGLAGDMINHRMRVASGEGVAATTSSLITVTAGGVR